MYKRALLGLGLGVFMATGAYASPNAEPGVHIHGNESQRVRKVGWTSSVGTIDIAAELKRAGEGGPSTYTSTKPSSGSGSSSSSGGRTSYYYSTSSSYASPSSSSYRSGPPVKVVLSGTETGLAAHPIRVAVFGGSKGGTFEQERQLKKLGKLVAEAKLPLLTGGGNGMPHVAQKAAYEAGGYTVGFGQAESLTAHRESGRPSDHLTVLYATGTGHGPGTIEREAPLAEQANFGIVAGGEKGTLGEVLASFFKPAGVLGFLKGSGGVADAFVKKILPHLGPLPSHIRIVEDSDPEKLIISGMLELDNIKGKAAAFPTSLVKVGKRPVLSSGILKDANVISYLVDGQGMSPVDRAKLTRLTKRINSEPIEGRHPVVVVPDRPGLTATVAKQAAAAGVSTVTLSHLGPPKIEKITDKHVRLFLDRGEGVGEFAAGREVTQDARVVIVAGGDYKTLSGLVYALHNDTLIAVLETGGMSGGLRSDIMPVISEKGSKAKVVYASDPDELFAKIQHELAPPPPLPPSKKSYSFDFDSDDSDRW